MTIMGKYNGIEGTMGYKGDIIRYYNGHTIWRCQIGGFHKWHPNSWLVFLFRERPIEMDGLGVWGYPYDLGNFHFRCYFRLPMPAPDKTELSINIDQPLVLRPPGERSVRSRR